MPKYGVSFGSFATTTSVLTALKLVTATKVPVEIVEAAMYGGGLVAAADIQHQCTLAAVSAAGAGTGTASPPTPEPCLPLRLPPCLRCRLSRLGWVRSSS